MTRGDLFFVSVVSFFFFLCCSDTVRAPGGAVAVHLRSALHLHRVASLGEVLVTDFLAVGRQVQPSAGEVPLLEKGHLRGQRGQDHSNFNRLTCPKQKNITFVHLMENNYNHIKCFWTLQIFTFFQKSPSSETTGDKKKKCQKKRKSGGKLSLQYQSCTKGPCIILINI